MQPRFNLCSKRANDDWRSSCEYQPSSCLAPGPVSVSRQRLRCSVCGSCFIVCMKKKRERETKEKLPRWINVASTIRIAPLPSVERTKHVHVKLNACPGKDYSHAAVCQFTCSHSLTLMWIARSVRNMSGLPNQSPLSLSRAAIPRQGQRVYTYSYQVTCLVPLVLS